MNPGQPDYSISELWSKLKSADGCAKKLEVLEQAWNKGEQNLEYRDLLVPIIKRHNENCPNQYFRFPEIEVQKGWGSNPWLIAIGGGIVVALLAKFLDMLTSM